MTTTTNTATFQAGQQLSARSACNHDCIFTGEVVSRKGNFVTIKTDMRGVRRVKIHNTGDGEFVFPFGRYSMAPIFRAPVAA